MDSNTGSWYNEDQTPGHPNPGMWYLGKESVPLTITPWTEVLSEALKRQVGGDHYKTAKIQPIEVIRDWELGFECGNALKYIARHLKKGEPKKDIQKSIHYLEMYLEELDK